MITWWKTMERITTSFDGGLKVGLTKSIVRGVLSKKSRNDDFFVISAFFTNAGDILSLFFEQHVHFGGFFLHFQSEINIFQVSDVLFVVGIIFMKIFKDVPALAKHF